MADSEVEIRIFETTGDPVTLQQWIEGNLTNIKSIQQSVHDR